jgi:putative ABC transport system ATP-binding protein
VSELPLVACEGASCAFGYGAEEHVVLRSVDCEVAPGARIAITGGAGAGKSTLLRLLAGEDEPTAGHVRWPALGERPEDEPGSLAVVFQEPSLLMPLTVEENVALGLMVSDLSPDDARSGARVALERLGVLELAEARPQELTAAQERRVAVACALVGAPRLILADEPTAGLAPGDAAAVLDTLIAAADKRGAALVLCTPDAGVAARMDARWALHDGRLIAADAPPAQRPAP